MTTPAPPTDTRTMSDVLDENQKLRWAIETNAALEATFVDGTPEAMVAEICKLTHELAATNARVEELESHIEELNNGVASMAYVRTKQDKYLAAAKARLRMAREALEIIANSPVTLEHENWLVSVAKDALDAPAGDAGGKDDAKHPPAESTGGKL